MTLPQETAGHPKVQAERAAVVQTDVNGFAAALHGAHPAPDRLFRCAQLRVKDHQVQNIRIQDRFLQLTAKGFHFRKFRHRAVFILSAACKILNGAMKLSSGNKKQKYFQKCKKNIDTLKQTV